MTTGAFHRNQSDLVPARPPPAATVGPLGWLRANLFSGWGNSLATLVILYLVWKLALPFFDWALVKAVWVAPDAAAMQNQGDRFTGVNQRSCARCRMIRGDYRQHLGVIQKGPERLSQTQRRIKEGIQAFEALLNNTRKGGIAA